MYHGFCLRIRIQVRVASGGVYRVALEPSWGAWGIFLLLTAHPGVFYGQ